MKKLILLIAALCFTSCGGGGDKPTETDISNALKKSWERGATSTAVASTVTINSITIGTSDESNLQQQMDGIPKDTTVTHAKIDFTQNEAYNNPKHTRRVMTALVYKDQFNEWAVMNAGVQYPNGY